jgi:DNA-binding cell septation regulator SpoVG
MLSLSIHSHVCLIVMMCCVRVEDGDFEAVLPPKPFETRTEQLADAVAESVEQAMEQKDSKRMESLKNIL